MNESQTRLDLIDPALKEAGWGVVPHSRIRTEIPITLGRLLGKGRREKPLIADYVLYYRDRPLAVVEAKAHKKYYTEGNAQAKDYADRLGIRFCYSTNGARIYGMDLETGTEGEIFAYPSPDALWAQTFPQPITPQEIEVEEWKLRFDAVRFEDRGGTWSPRYYQRNAIYKVLYAIAEKQDRLLLTMATGTGKTAIAFQICWKLFQSKWNLRRDAQQRPRILFLADRNILADQAYNAFSAFDFIDENIKVRIRPEEIRKAGHVPKNGSLFFTIFQTFMSSAHAEDGVGENEEVERAPQPEDFHFGQYPPDFFDLIIIDECHRGGANDESSWRGILEYFSPAVQLGLTATPKRDVNRNTYQYFGEVPVYTYALKTGINDGFLTPFKVKDIRTNYDEYTFTSDDVILDGEAEVGDTFTYRDYGRKIVLQQVEEFRVKKFLELINQRRKTLVFCATQHHAALVRDLINQFSDSSNPQYCERVTADDGTLGERSLRNFQDNEKTIPTILTTSQKLSTGVDAPEIRNIVLLRPVDSMVEFKQIVGRGTRLYDGKDHFTVYDFVRAHEHFQDPAWDGDPLTAEPYTPPNTDGPPLFTDLPLDEVCSRCGHTPCLCEGEPPRRTLRVRLSDNKEREIDATVRTSFWDPSGQPISSAEFIQRLYGDLPSLFRDEAELRRLWSKPSTRQKLLDDLADRGYSSEQLAELRALVHGEDSDLFDVLAYVAYHKELVPRADRAARATVYLQDYDPAQQEFLNFVLRQYVDVGESELGEAKMAPLLTVKYRTLQDAIQQLGNAEAIRKIFFGFQERLYGDAG